jgi:RNA polymerase sigma-70 factor, ECF subfamily
VTGPTRPSADHARFEHLYAQTRIAVLGYLLRRCGDPADAADLLAETYLIAWRRIQDIPDGDRARAWVFGVARRTLANHRRHQRVEGRLAHALRTDLVSELRAATPSGDPAFRDVIAGCLAGLKPIDREIIELAVYDELSPAEIAVVVGKSAGAIRVRLHRIRQTLRLDLLRAGHRDGNPELTTQRRAGHGA